MGSFGFVFAAYKSITLRRIPISTLEEGRNHRDILDLLPQSCAHAYLVLQLPELVDIPLSASFLSLTRVNTSQARMALCQNRLQEERLVKHLYSSVLLC